MSRQDAAQCHAQYNKDMESLEENLKNYTPAVRPSIRFSATNAYQYNLTNCLSIAGENRRVVEKPTLIKTLSKDKK